MRLWGVPVWAWIFLGVVAWAVAGAVAWRAGLGLRQDIAEIRRAEERTRIAQLARSDTLVLVYRQVDSMMVRELRALRRRVAALNGRHDSIPARLDELEIAFRAQARALQRLREQKPDRL